MYSLEKFRAKENESYNYVSYGNEIGKFNIPIQFLPKIILEKNICKNYALVEKKTEYYKLMFDFDYKPITNKLDNKSKQKDNTELFRIYNNKENEITNFVIEKINLVLNSIFDEPNIKYIYCDKNIGEGVHLYYPHIIVNKIIHGEIMDRLYNLLLEDNTYKNDINLWKAIVDGCISKANGLRLPYFENKDKLNQINYYKPNFEKSTYELVKSKQDHILLCCINTDFTINMPKLKIEINQTKIVKNINKIRKCIEGFKMNNEIVYIDMDVNRQLIFELFEVLKIERLDDYNNWIQFVCFCRNYNLYNECIEISKKSHKFDNDSLNIINQIFNKTTIPEKYLSLASLIKWSKEDNFNLCADICYKYNIKFKLEINDLDEYLYKNIKYDIQENNKYITKLDDIYNNIANGIRTILIHSPTGSGKTTAIEKIINHYIENIYNGTKDDISILSIVSRRSMCGTHLKCFKNLNLKSYLDDQKFTQKYISSIEHLKSYNFYKYNIVILDEINSLISYLYSNTLDGRRLQCFQNLCRILFNANLVLCCDSNITNMVYEFIEKQRNIFGNILKYRNICKNKTGVNMVIYKCKSLNIERKIYSFCELMKNEVENNKSLLIFSDSKYITIMIKELLLKYNNNEDYYRLINKDYGTLEEIIDCNNQFINKCVIASPKIVYGVDITIPYENIYCIYKYTNTSNSMSSMEYHQQYSRARNCKNVIILNLNYFENNNKYIPFQKHIEEEDKLFNKMKEYQGFLCKNYKIINDMCSDFDIYGQKINKQNIFANIHYYKSWYDKLFGINKMQLVKKLAEDAGYNIFEKELVLEEIPKGEIKNIKNMIKKYTDNINELYDYILNCGDINQKDHRLATNIIEEIYIRMKIFNIYNIEDLPDLIKEFVKDINKMKTYINKKYLNMDKKRFDEISIQLTNTDIPQLAKDNKIIRNIRILEKLEQIVEINRYEIENIKEDIDISKIKQQILENKQHIILLDDDMRSNNEKIKRLENNIKKITTRNQLQKFIVDCYNEFGYIFNIDSKRCKKDKILYTKYIFTLLK
jgi:cob(I)alamin adenosyltransferase